MSGEERFCTACGDKLDEDVKFCTTCGEPVKPAPSSAPIDTCRKCGFQLEKGDEFCRRCGESISTKGIPVFLSIPRIKVSRKTLKILGMFAGMLVAIPLLIFAISLFVGFINSPTATVKKYYTYLAKGKYDSAYDLLVVPSDLELFSPKTFRAANLGMDKEIGKITTFQVRKPAIQGDEARLQVVLKRKSAEYTQSLTLERHNTLWFLKEWRIVPQTGAVVFTTNVSNPVLCVDGVSVRREGVREESGLSFGRPPGKPERYIFWLTGLPLGIHEVKMTMDGCKDTEECLVDLTNGDKAEVSMFLEPTDKAKGELKKAIDEFRKIWVEARRTNNPKLLEKVCSGNLLEEESDKILDNKRSGFYYVHSLESANCLFFWLRDPSYAEVVVKEAWKAPKVYLLDGTEYPWMITWRELGKMVYFLEKKSGVWLTIDRERQSY